MSVIPTEGTYSKLGTALHTVFLLWLRGLRTQLVSMRMQVRSLALLSELRIWRLLWLWCRLAAVALIWPLAWEPPYVVSTALKRPKKKKKGETSIAVRGRQARARWGQLRKQGFVLFFNFIRMQLIYNVALVSGVGILFHVQGKTAVDFLKISLLEFLSWLSG